MLSSRVQRRRRNTTLVPGGGGDAALERSPSSLRARERQRRVVVTQEILMEALGGVRPSVSEPERNRYSKMLVLVRALCVSGSWRMRRKGGADGVKGGGGWEGGGLGGRQGWMGRKSWRKEKGEGNRMADGRG